MPIVRFHKDGAPYEMFALRDRSPVRLRIIRKAVTEDIKLDIYDLDKSVFIAEGISEKVYDAGVTSHDFVLIFR